MAVLAGPSSAHAVPHGQDVNPVARLDLERSLTTGLARIAGTPSLAGLAAAAATLWTRALKFDAADPHWPDRDRFVMAVRHGAPLLQALRRLTGLEPEETGADHCGAPAQGLGVAVGLALAERLLAARFGKSLVDHRTWVIACDACLVSGLSHEAAELAGHLRLDKLTVLACEVQGDGAPPDVASGDVLKRFAASGWAVQRVGQDGGEIASALSFAVRAKKPTLLVVQTPAGPPDGAEWCGPPDGLAERWQRAGSRGTAARRGWLKRLTRHPQRAEFDRVIAGRLPESWHEALAAVKAALAATRPPPPTDAAGRHILAALAPAVPELVGGCTEFCAGHDPLRAAGTVGPGAYGGRTVLYGQREHAMAASATGLALHGGVIPAAAAPLAGSDAMRPALRLAAALRQRVIHVLTEHGVNQGSPEADDREASLRDQGQLAALRALPGLLVFRPADAVETAECWELALRRGDGPSLIVLGRQPASLRGEGAENRCARGGYVLAEADGPRHATLIASGAEVLAAMAARQALAMRGVGVAVVSLVCWELFGQTDGATQDRVLGGAPRFGLEGACSFGWERWLGGAGQFLDLTQTGPGPVTDAIVARVLKRVAS